MKIERVAETIPQEVMTNHPEVSLASSNCTFEPPARWVQQLRVEAARQHLDARGPLLRVIATMTGLLVCAAQTA